MTISEIIVPTCTQMLGKLLRPPDCAIAMIRNAPVAAREMWQNYVWPFMQVNLWPERARKFRDENAMVHLTVLVSRGHDLKADEISFSTFRRTSDPYVRIRIGLEVQQTKTIRKSLNPVWNEELHWHARYCTLREAPLLLEVFDEDQITTDDSLGVAQLDLLPIVDLARSAESRTGESSGGDSRVVHSTAEEGPLSTSATCVKLKLSVQGEVSLQVTVHSVCLPSWTEVCSRWLKPLLIRFRAFFLYQRIPYDRSVWSQMRDPWYYVMFLLSASPVLTVRCAFYTVYLICIAIECEEFQVLKFMLSLKGTQFISGLFKLCHIGAAFWYCLVDVRHQDGCHVLNLNVGVSVLVLLWLQILLWIAGVLLLPYSGQVDPQSGKLNFARAKRLWAHAKGETFDEQPEDGSQQQLAGKDSKQTSKNPPKFSASAWIKTRVGVHFQNETLPEPAPLPTPRTPNPRKDGYVAIEEAYSHQTSDDFPPRADTVGPAAVGQGASTSKLPSRSRADTTKSPGTSRVPAVFRWVADGTRSRWADLMAATNQMRMPREEENRPHNRIYDLFIYDQIVFLCCMILFFLMALESMRYELASHRQVELGFLMEHLDALAALFASHRDGNLWLACQMDLTFSLAKVIFMLSSFPFFIIFLLNVGGLSKIISHTDPTAYTSTGHIVSVDSNGLSALLAWLKEDLLAPTSKYAAELSNSAKFSPRDIHHLRTAIADGEEFLRSAGTRGAHSFYRMTSRKKAEIEGILSKVVTREAASSHLFKHCFPNQVVIDEYKEAPSSMKVKPLG